MKDDTLTNSCGGIGWFINESVLQNCNSLKKKLDKSLEANDASKKITYKMQSMNFHGQRIFFKIDVKLLNWAQNTYDFNH